MQKERHWRVDGVQTTEGGGLFWRVKFVDAGQYWLHCDMRLGQ